MKTIFFERIKEQVQQDYLFDKIKIEVKKYFLIMRVSLAISLIFLCFFIFRFNLLLTNFSFLVFTLALITSVFFAIYILFKKDKIIKELRNNLKAEDREKINELFIKKIKEVKEDTQNKFLKAKDSLDTYQREIIAYNIFLGSNT